MNDLTDTVAPHTEVQTISGLRIHAQRYQVEIDGRFQTLTAGEMAVLLLLAKRPERVFPHAEILDAYHQGYHEVSERAVKILIYRLRQKLGRYRDLIQAVRGVGYVMRPRVTMPCHAWPVGILMSLGWLSPRHWWPSDIIARAALIMLTMMGGGTLVAVSLAGSSSPTSTSTTNSTIASEGSFLGWALLVGGPEQHEFAQSVGGPALDSIEHGFGAGFDRIDEHTYVSIALPDMHSPRNPARLHTWYLELAPKGNTICFFPRYSDKILESGGRVWRPLKHAEPTVIDPHNHFSPTAAVRRAENGELYVLNFTGTAVKVCSSEARQLRTIALPRGFDKIYQPPQAPRSAPHLQPRPFENLALTPSGDVYVMGCRPLAEDVRGDSAEIQIIRLDPKGHTSFRVPLEASDHSVHDLIAVNDLQLLVLERGPSAPGRTGRQLISLIDLSAVGTTKMPLLDVTATLPSNLRDARLEGLAWGPCLPSGQRTLLAVDTGPGRSLRSSRLLAFVLPNSVVPM